MNTIVDEFKEEQLDALAVVIKEAVINKIMAEASNMKRGPNRGLGYPERFREELRVVPLEKLVEILQQIKLRTY